MDEDAKSKDEDAGNVDVANFKSKDDDAGKGPVVNVAGDAKVVNQSKENEAKDVVADVIKDVVKKKDVRVKDMAVKPVNKKKVTEVEVKDVGGKAMHTKQAKVIEDKEDPLVAVKKSKQSSDKEVKDQDASNAPVCADVAKKVVKPVNKQKVKGYHSAKGRKMTRKPR